MNVNYESDENLGLISYSAKKEIEAVCSWYRNWRGDERKEFCHTVAKLIAPQVDDIMSVLGNIKIENTWSAPNIFSCQMKLLRDWWRLWDSVERKFFEVQLGTHLDEDDLIELRKSLTV